MVPEIVIEIVDAFKGKIPVNVILDVLDVSSTTYYRWKSKGTTSKDLSVNEQAVINLCKETKYLYGYRKITPLLKREM